jgi:hypothetical protein
MKKQMIMNTISLLAVKLAMLWVLRAMKSFKINYIQYHSLQRLNHQIFSSVAFVFGIKKIQISN